LIKLSCVGGLEVAYLAPWEDDEYHGWQETELGRKRLYVDLEGEIHSTVSEEVKRAWKEFGSQENSIIIKVNR
jgi:hypothetical protein